MATHPSVIFLLLIVAANPFHASRGLHLPPAAAGACIPQEREALLAFKRGITGDPAGRLASWQEGEEDCCRWSGVRCSNGTGHVVGLHLRNPADDLDLTDTALAGQISPSITSLHRLKYLDLSKNNVSGPTSRVPEFLGLLGNLRYLNLSGIPFYGRVPPQLGNLSKLHYLDLSAITNRGPWGTYLNSTDISWLSNLPLRYLNMDYAYLLGIEDWAHVVNMIPSLKVLRLTDCGLPSANQSLPRLNLTNLEELGLSGNLFYHPLSSCWFWNSTSLRYLELARPRDGEYE
nr:unnamed protein product [Digitaria exilis]